MRSFILREELCSLNEMRRQVTRLFVMREPVVETPRENAKGECQEQKAKANCGGPFWLSRSDSCKQNRELRDRNASSIEGLDKNTAKVTEVIKILL
jgi:hypothetical protein